MKGKKGKLASLVSLTILSLTLGLVSCSGDLNEQESFKAQKPPVVLPSTNSLPTEGKERTYSLEEGKSLTNPVVASAASIARGKELFLINCAPCHGPLGRGDGPVGKKFVPQPADLSSARIQDKSDGEIFITITLGISTMPNFRKELRPEERWQVVNFIRTLKAKGTAKSGGPG